MKNTPRVAILPIGGVGDVPKNDDFEIILQTVSRLGAEVLPIDPIADEETVGRVVHTLVENHPHLLLIVPLHGLTAPLIAATASAISIPCLICPIQGQFSLPSSTLAFGALREQNRPVELLYASPEQPIFQEKLGVVVRAAKAFSSLRTSRVGVIGELFSNLISCCYDPAVLQSRLGISLLPISFEQVRAARQACINQVSEMKRIQQELVTIHRVISEDHRALESGIQLHMALKRIAEEQGLDGFAVECWSGFPRELGLNPCLGFVEDAYTLACEGDMLLWVGLLLVSQLTGRNPYAGDLYDLDMEGILTLVHCGAPASLAIDPAQVILSPSQVAHQRGFETITCRPPLESGPVTLVRLFGRAADHLHVALGELEGSEQSPNLTARVKLAGDRWDFLEQCFGNHYVLAKGDIRRELALLCRWLKISLIET